MYSLLQPIMICHPVTRSMTSDRIFQASLLLLSVERKVTLCGSFLPNCSILTAQQASADRVGLLISPTFSKEKGRPKYGSRNLVIMDSVTCRYNVSLKTAYRKSRKY